VKALVIGDVHLGDKPPSVRTDTYQQDILAKLEFCVAEAKRQSCDVIIQAGDMFHIKTPSRTSHNLVRSAMEILTAEDIPTVITPGNHDMQHDRLDSLDSQPLGVLAKAPGISLLIGPHPDFPIFGIPFLQNWMDLPHSMNQYVEWSKQFVPMSGKPDAPLLITHAPIMPPGQSAPYEFIGAPDWAALMQNGNCYYGHIHDLHGSYTAGNVNFCNQGALSRGSLHETDLRRKPAVTIFDSLSSPTTFTRVEVPHKPVSECYRMADVDKIESGQVRLDSFLRQVGSTTIETASVEGILAHIRSLDLSERTVVEATRLLEEAASK